MITVTDVVKTIAPAKLTLWLRITGVRPDGYHLIDAEMTTLDLHDRLEIRELADANAARDGQVNFTGPFATGLVDDDRNLVRRALNFVGRRADVVLEKNIPHGGGLGGGSADAAAMLRWAGITTSDVIDMSVDTSIDASGKATEIATQIAHRLGADVPFCLVGGRARVRGIGEIIDPVAHQPGVVTLVVPPFSVSTPAVYRAWDELGGPRSDGPNDLEPAALAVEPRLALWRDVIATASGALATLAGSGATWFVHGDHVDGIRAAFAEASKSAPDQNLGNTQVFSSRHA